MKQKQHRIAIVGCGHVLDRHLQALENLQDKFRIIAQCDLNPLKSKAMAYQNYQKMLSDLRGKADLIVINTPNYLHYPQAKLALEFGYDVLVEKPATLSFQDAALLDTVAVKQKKKAYVVLQVRHNPLIKTLKQLIKENALGKTRSVSFVQRWQRPVDFFNLWRGDFNLSGGLLFEFSFLYLDALQWIFDSPQVISASGFNLKHKNLSYPDTIFSVFRFPSGAAGSLEVTVAAEPTNLECSISVFGEKGALKISGASLNWLEYAYTSNDNQKVSSIPTKASKPSPYHVNIYRDIYEGSGLTIKESLSTIKLVENIYKKLRVSS